MAKQGVILGSAAQLDRSSGDEIRDIRTKVRFREPQEVVTLQPSDGIAGTSRPTSFTGTFEAQKRTESQQQFCFLCVASRDIDERGIEEGRIKSRSCSDAAFQSTVLEATAYRKIPQGQSHLV